VPPGTVAPCHLSGTAAGVARPGFMAWGPHANPLDLANLFLGLKFALLALLSTSISRFSFLPAETHEGHEISYMSKFRVKEADSALSL